MLAQAAQSGVVELALFRTAHINMNSAAKSTDVNNMFATSTYGDWRCGILIDEGLSVRKCHGGRGSWHMRAGVGATRASRIPTVDHVRLIVKMDDGDAAEWR